MAGHYIELASDGGELEVRFVCENHRGDPCHRAYPSEGEHWDEDTSNLVDGDECWAMSWWDSVGLDALVVTAPDGPLTRVPVEITYDEGIVATPDPAPAGEVTSASSRPAGAPLYSEDRCGAGHVLDCCGGCKCEGTQHE